MMADSNYSHLSVHTFDIFTKAVAQPGGRNVTNTSTKSSEIHTKCIFKNLQSLLGNFLPKMERLETGVSREHGRHALEYYHGILTRSSGKRIHIGSKRRS